MSKLKRVIGRRAARAAVHHSAHGVVAKVQRKPLRSATMLGFGALAGAAGGWLAGRRSSLSS